MAWTPTHYYVRPTNGSDTPGGGTSHAAAYQSTQYAIDDIFTVTHGYDTTNGVQLNICDEAADLITTALTLPAGQDQDQPFYVRGYTLVANDGGIGHWDGNNNNNMIADWDASADGWIYVRDMKMGNTGTARIFSVESWCVIIDCEFYSGTSAGTTGAVFTDNYNQVYGCYFHDITQICLSGDYGNTFFGNYVVSDDSTNYAIRAYRAGNISRNFLRLSSNANGILADDACQVVHNSILADVGATGHGYLIGDNDLRGAMVCVGNLVEGFTGVSGVGFDCNLSTPSFCQNNAAYNCDVLYDTAELIPLNVDIADIDNEELSESPFAKHGADTFANRFNYFRPRDIGNVRRGGGLLRLGLDKGAVQYRENKLWLGGHVARR